MNKELQKKSSLRSTSTKRSTATDVHTIVGIKDYFVSTLKNHLSNNVKFISRSSLFNLGSSKFVTSMPYDYPTTSKLQTSTIRYNHGICQRTIKGSLYLSFWEEKLRFSSQKNL